MKVAFIGSGNVGGSVALKLAEEGHTIILGARDAKSKSVQKILQKGGSKVVVKTVGEAVKDADVVFLATPYVTRDG
jgi:predicted dinucleotide-binding enzyme